MPLPGTLRHSSGAGIVTKSGAPVSQVRIDPEVRTPVWPSGADFDSETLHDWPSYSYLLAARAGRWQQVSRCRDYENKCGTNRLMFCVIGLESSRMPMPQA